LDSGTKALQVAEVLVDGLAMVLAEFLDVEVVVVERGVIVDAPQLDLDADRIVDDPGLHVEWGLVAHGSQPLVVGPPRAGWTAGTAGPSQSSDSPDKLA
jgi:hypothetical protein